LYIIIDGSNVAFHKRTHKKKARFQNLQILINFLRYLEKKYPIRWDIIIDASLRHYINDQRKLEESISTGKIIQCPSKVEADCFILEFFKLHSNNTVIISNDNFKEYQVSNLKLFKFVIMCNQIIIYPNLSDFLYKLATNSKEVESIV